MSRTVTIPVDVDVELSDLDTDVLEDELATRKGATLPSSVDLGQMRDAMARCDHRLALELLRTYLQDQLGCVLP